MLPPLGQRRENAAGLRVRSRAATAPAEAGGPRASQSPHWLLFLLPGAHRDLRSSAEEDVFPSHFSVFPVRGSSGPSLCSTEIKLFKTEPTQPDL